MFDLGDTKKNLCNLLRYTSETLALNQKVILDLRRDAIGAYHEHLVAALEGVDANVDTETWLRIHRLRETNPPAHDPLFEGWIDSPLHPSPDHPPTLVAERMLRLSVDEISELMEAGLIAGLDDVMIPLGTDEPLPESLDAILRIKTMPEFCRLWQDYLDGPWVAWARLERPRRQSIDFYNKIYQVHQRILAMGDDTPIEMVFGLGIARWKTTIATENGRQEVQINVPLIEQLVELELEEDGTLFVRPRNTPPQLTLKAFSFLGIKGSKTLQRDVAEQFARQIEDPDVGFSPFDKTTFESVLKSCAARLSATGLYRPDTLDDPDDRNLADLSDTLTISDTWVLYVRQRNDDFRTPDINRLINRIDQAESVKAIPRSGLRFILPAGAMGTGIGDDCGIDLSNSSLILPDSPRSPKYGGNGAGGGRRGPDDEVFFLPLAYNNEQREILRHLEDDGNDGVLVQGPPGTGKTHTIANIVCHYLATERRVLVAARTPEALTALQEKLPEGVRDLAIAVIHNDREGARQLEHAVQVLSSEAKQINKKAVEADIRDKQCRIAELRKAIAACDHDLLVYAERNLKTLKHEDDEILPMELARRVRENSEQHAWFPDELDFSERFDLKFGAAEIDKIRTLRRTLGSDLVYRRADLIDPAQLPDLARIAAAHGALARLNEIETGARAGEIPLMSLATLGLSEARSVHEWLTGFAGLMAEIQGEHWLLSAYHGLIANQKLDAITTAALKQALEQWATLHAQGIEISLRAPFVGDMPLEESPFDRAVADLAAGRKPFGLFGFLKGRLKAQIETVRVDGGRPADAAGWQLVQRFRAWQRDVSVFGVRWNAIAHAIGAPAFRPDVESCRAEFLRLGHLVRRFVGLVNEVAHHRTILQTLFPCGLDLDAVFIHGRCAEVLEALAVNVEKSDLASAETLRQDLRALAVEKKAARLHEALAEFAFRLGSSDIRQSEIVETWKRIRDEAERLFARKDALTELDALTSLIASSGAPQWAQALRTTPPEAEDRLIPAYWGDSWEWARASGFIRSLSDRDKIRSLSSLRAEADAEQKKLFADVVRLRAFLGLKQALDRKPSIQSALAKFTSAVGRLGKGTGKTANRHRRVLRDATLEASEAVPCWILPEWRVCEQLPAELAVFDLVIIDEASQSDITALPVLLRGKKVLIVGDDKQVSPSAIGIPDNKIVQLRSTYLSGLPIADHIEPSTSLYELGGMVYPGNVIMLREHFRCVEPIIRFSSRFYPKPLIPLRLPKASERLDPPLIDIYVPHGERRKDLNTAESDVICDEIAKIIGDPAMRRRTIGVISLIGAEQAKNIHDRLMRDLGAEVIDKHRIMCGNPSVFQGQERDIVFLSMVADKHTVRSQSSRQIEQRVNVAMSRARDRVVLVRSVTASQLKPEDLKLKIIEHFRNPMAGGNIAQGDDILSVCESGFEIDFGKRLLAMGYRLRPQVPVGGYRIDFVIEGDNDRRLAVELDGDKYHGPGKWAEDIHRQMSLERLGWTFWRCWGSNWIADPEGCLDDLQATLKSLGVEPIGAAPVEANYTRHIIVEDPTAGFTKTDEQSAEQAIGASTVALPLAEPAPKPVGAGATVADIEPTAPPPEPERVAPPAIKDPFPFKKEAIAFDKQQAAKAPVGAPAALVLTPPPASQIRRIPRQPAASFVFKPMMQPPAALAVAEEDRDAYSGSIAEVGDLVVIRFSDQPEKPLRVRLSKTENRPGDGIVHIFEPLGEALLGAAAEDEVEVDIGGMVRIAFVEKVEKAETRVPAG